MNFFLILTTIFLFICLTGFTQQKLEKEFSWLAGTWQQEGKKVFEEWHWQKNEWTAISYRLDASGEKQVDEEIRLTEKEEKFFYIPDVAGEQGSVPFEITSFYQYGFVAENPTHDFPKKITYKKIDESHLLATISDENKTISYHFIKVK